MKPTIFISYSHKDEIWKDKLKPQLTMLEKGGWNLHVWDDRKIDAGDTWYPEIKEAMDTAIASICLISAHYLSSDFCVKEEIPYLLERRTNDGMTFIPVLVSPCNWKAIHWLKEIQMLPRDGKAVSKLSEAEQDEIFATVSENICGVIDKLPKVLQAQITLPIVVRATLTAAHSPQTLATLWPPLDNKYVYIDHLPQTGAELFGRQKELEMLDHAWESAATNIISLVAWGGVGKSTLVNKWLERMAADNYRGATRVFGWSFYSQGTGERVTAADTFIREALAWFGDPDPNEGSAWAKSERLARLIQDQKTLLILDGLEPLQSGDKFDKGKVKDAALSVLISRLARTNPGLCIITTREAVSDLDKHKETVQTVDLMQISAEAGRALLRVRGVHGNDHDLEEAVRNFGNNALAVNLLASWLQGLKGHDITAAEKIPDLPDIPVEKGKHARRIIEAFVQRFGAGPEAELLSLTGFFDRPAELATLWALCKGGPLPGLTQTLANLDELQRHKLIESLRKERLFAPESRHRPDVIDCHPLIREHFGEKVQKENPKGWKQAHERLYEYYRNLPKKKYPDTLAEMEPLFRAVAHGCQAGRHQEALYDVYWERIRRKKEGYSVHKLGAFSADLAAVSHFFAEPWRKPAEGLTEADKAVVLSWAGFELRALGRLREAEDPMQSGLQASLVQKDWKGAAQDANNLSELYLTLGDVDKAVDYGQQCVEFADKSEDASWMMASRTTPATALHQAGNVAGAERLFREAEAMQVKSQPEYRFLYAVQGHWFCDLLLAQGKYEEALERAEEAIKIAQRNNWLPPIALDNLTLGRAQILAAQAQTNPDFAQASHFLDEAVDGFRKASAQHHVPRGLLARAALYRAQGNFPQAWADLNEALEIAERGEMKLHLTDCHLEAARLCEAEGNSAPAADHWQAARKLIDETGYNRRLPELPESMRP